MGFPEFGDEGRDDIVGLELGRADDRHADRFEQRQAAIDLREEVFGRIRAMGFVVGIEL
ncbi:MAG: hypothetical protein KF705_04430 [Phycisphaeraceae bacterium]|nr:hypothetical protein [Phycisphaeraceae bacterium]